MLACWRVALPLRLPSTKRNPSGFRSRAETPQVHANGGPSKKSKVVIVGSGWAGLGAAHHLCNQGFDVTVLEGDDGFGYPDTIAIQGYYRTFQNIFSLVDGLGIKPFTNWTKSAQYSEEGLEVEFPVFQDLPQLPTPLGTLYYSQFIRLPLLDRLTFLPLMAAVIDFDNTDTAWRKYDSTLCTREDFLKVLNLGSIDVLTIKLWLDQKVNIPIASNACSGFDNSFGWTFFDLNVIQDEHKSDSVTVLQADFYYANELLPLKDKQIVMKVMSYLSKYIKEFENASVVDKEIGRYPKCLTHFFPGSYKYMMRGSTSFPNLFMAGDWIVNRHGSWAQEKSYITGLEAANLVVDYFGEGSFAKILPVEEPESHIQTFRTLNRRFNEIRAQLPLSSYFPQ